MPELPDVEGYRRTLAEHAAGRWIKDVVVRDPGVLRGVSAGQLIGQLRGRRFAAPRRHGKWLIEPVGGPVLLMHFGMTGGLRWTTSDAPAGRFERVSFVTAAGDLRYDDMRKLTGISLAEGEAQAGRLLGSLGPDALAVRSGELTELLRGRRTSIKAVLMNQDVIAGLGNLLTDEILWRACVHPRRSARALGENEVRRLASRMRWVLENSIRAGCVPSRPRWLTTVRNRPSACCPRCETALCRGRNGGRTSVWCPRCQALPGG